MVIFNRDGEGVNIAAWDHICLGKPRFKWLRQGGLDKASRILSQLRLANCTQKAGKKLAECMENEAKLQKDLDNAKSKAAELRKDLEEAKAEEASFCSAVLDLI